MIPLRRFAERLSRGVVLRRRLPPPFGGRPLLVTPDSRLRYWRRNLNTVEPELLNWAVEFVQEGMTVWDVGANVGVFTFAAAVRAGSGGRVVAMEPDLDLARLLQRSTAFQGDLTEAPVTVLPLAAAEHIDLAQFEIARRGRSSNYLATAGGSTQSGGSRSSVPVLTVSLDWLSTILGPPSVLKIDVEGAEVGVFRGGRTLLCEARPVVLAEISARNRRAVSDLFCEVGYVMYDLAVREPERRVISVPADNTLFLPEERALARLRDHG